MGLLFREHPKAQPKGGFRRSPGSNLRPLVYKASDLTTAPRSTPLIELFGIYKMCKMLNHSRSDVGISNLCQILLLYGAKTNKTLV